MFLCGSSLQSADIPGVLREFYAGIPQSTVSFLTNSVVYPDRPTTSNLMSGLFESTVDQANEYGQRFRAILEAPATGTYVFFVCSDDQSLLYLSQDENPANKQLIAAEPAWNPSRDWFTTTRRTGGNALQFFPSMNPNLPANRSDYAYGVINLTAGNRYYIEAIHKEGGGGDNFALGWNRPDGSGGTVFEGPVSTEHFYLYGITNDIPPVIIAHPQDISAVERTGVAFEVDADSFAPASYQWQVNGQDIPGANDPAYSIPAVSLDQDGERYRCIVSSGLGTTASSEAVLTVLPDTVQPTVVRVTNEGTDRILVTFSETVDAAGALNLASYSVSGQTLSNAGFLGEAGQTVALTTSGLVIGNTYTIKINGIRDTAAVPNTIDPNTQVNFIASSYTAWTVGDPGQGGSVIMAGSGAFDMNVAARGIGGGHDQFLMNYQQRTGNFDITARVASFSNSDLWAKAGLMARSTLATNSPFAGILATPSISGIVFSSRQTFGGNTATTGSFPVNYPYSWVRLQRNNNTFTGYASYDGSNWFEVGQRTLTLPSTLYVGLAATSNDPAETTTVGFRNVTETGAATLIPSRPQLEPPGPSTRRTGLTFTEIMYHPADHPEGRALEFIEVFNSQPVSEDLSGFRLTGDIDFTFPPGTILEAGGYLVVANEPADVQAVYGLVNVLGPYVGNLPNDDGVLQLRHRAGALLLSVEYDSVLPWPVAADGTGHSLVLRSPTYGEEYPEAWDASSLKGGSPGSMDGFIFDQWNDVVINEWLAHTDEPQVDFIELYNHSNQSIDISGAFLSDDASTNKYTIPPGTTLGPRSFATFDQTILGFALSSGGEPLFLTTPDNQRVVDAVRFEGQENGVSSGRFPDGSDEFSPLQFPTPGSGSSGANAAPLLGEVVINEIMYNPISGNDDDEYIELFNRSNQSVDLSGWQFLDGFDFIFPEGVSIPSQGYLVVARNAQRLITNYPALNTGNTIGPLGGTLANSGERLILAKPDEVVSTNLNLTLSTNQIYIPVDEVSYVDGGRWGRWIDGGGSSLELRNPDSDNRYPSNWTHSDESAKAEWVTLEHTGVLNLGQTGGGRSIDEVQVMLLGDGECLIDDIEVFTPTSGNLVFNGSFPLGVNGWTIEGNHVDSGWNSTEGFNAAGSLHLRASGGGDNGANRLKTDLTSFPSPGETATIRCRVRWLAGSTNLLVRLYGNYLELSGELQPPAATGTPGTVNSAFTANTGPAIWNTTHNPVLPSANQDVVVTTYVADPDGLSSVNLNYRIDPVSTLTTVTMRDDGTSGDGIANDGVFSAIIPGQPTGTLVAFHVEATDAGSAVSTFPQDVPDQEALVRFGETLPFGNFGTYRFWLTSEKIQTWENRANLSNEALDVTFTYGHHRVVYNAGIRYRGSPFLRPGYSGPTGSLCAYVFEVPRDDKFLGFREFNLDWLEQPGRDPSLQREKLSFWIANQMDVPFSYQSYIYIFVNGVRRGLVYTDSQQPNSDYIRAWFDGADLGDIYKVDDWFEFNDIPQREFNVNATLQNFTSGGEKKKARYRWSWEKKSNRGIDDDYSTLFSLVDALNTLSDEDYTRAVTSLVDVEQWLKVFAVRHIVGDWDGYGYERGKNMFTYKKPNGRFNMLLWDLDFSLGGGSRSPTDDIYTTTDPTISRFYAHPPFRRLYLQIMKEAVEGPLAEENIHPVMDENFLAFQENFVGVEDPSAIKIWVQNRADFLMTQVNAIEAPFEILTNGGGDIVVQENLLLLEGTAPVDVRTITVNGVAFPVTWITPNTWQLRIPLNAGSNALNIAGIDLNGNPVPGSSGTINATFNGTPDPADGNIVINEIMYHPTVDDSEYVEILNRSGTTAFDLTGWRFNGIDFIFPGGTVLEPGQYLVVTKSASVFHPTFGSSIPLAGEFDGSLDNGGETISLFRPGSLPGEEILIDSVFYDDTPPWPSAADAMGSSLQLRDPVRDNNRLGNWETAAPQSGGEEVVELIDVTDSWRYEQSNTDLGTQWRAPAYNDSTWPQGNGLFYVESSPLSAPKNTPLTLGAPTYYFRTHFNNPSTSTNLQLELSLFLDDGAVVYLNGWEILRIRMPEDGLIEHSTFATTTVDNAVLEGPFILPSDRLQNGDNVIAVEVHQTNADSSDVVFGLDLQARSNTTGPYSPGMANTTLLTLPAFPDVWINEIQPVNTGDATDSGGDQDPWLELYNAGTTPFDLSGLYLSDDYNDLTKWSFPAGTSIGPGEWKLVWLDGEPGEGSATEPHTSFAIDSNPGGVALSRRVNGRNVILDYVNYPGIQAGRSRGLYPDAARYSHQDFFFATPGAANNNVFPEVTLTINEWMADNETTLANPLGGAFDDWFELYNAGSESVNLSGYYLTDDLSNLTQWQIPQGTVIGPGSFLVVWADNLDTTDTNPLHTNFRLNNNGESIGLIAPNFNVVDSVTFGEQFGDMTQGRYQDGMPAPFVYLTTPTPGTANIYNPPGFIVGGTVRNPVNGHVTLEWQTESGRSYIIRYKDNLSDPLWIPLTQIFAPGPEQTFIDSTAAGIPERYYLIELVP